MTSQFVTFSFLTALLVATSLRFWLSQRQMHHVAAHRNTVPAAFTETVSLADHQKAADYCLARTRLARTELAVDVVLTLILTYGGLLQVFDQASVAMSGERGHLYGLFLFACFALTGFCLGLPFDIYRTFVLEERFGFNRTTPRQFALDLMKQALLTLLIGAPVLFVALWLMSAMGSLWWLYVWLFWLGFNLLVMLLYPTWIAPLFNTFSPLTDDALKTRINALLARCQFAAAGLFVMDGSKRSAHGNAYFTGFGRARRIVFYDTLLEKLNADEIEGVLAHELGHFKRRHIWKSMVVMATISLILLIILGQLLPLPAFYQGLGVSTPSAAMALLLFSIALPVFAFPLRPLFSALSRRHEYEADAYARQNSGAAALVSALVKLYRDNATTLTPDSLHSLFYDSHPPAALRIARLNAAAA